MRRLLRTRTNVALLAVVGLLMTMAASFGVSNLPAGPFGHLGMTAARADTCDDGSDDTGDDTCDDDGGAELPWISYYAKESSLQPITMAELQQATQQANAIPSPGPDALAADRPDERRRPGGRPRR